jgi:outer membrane biosynthesis protein TonB
MEATLMKLIGAISTAVLSLILAAPAYAQQEQHDQEEAKKPAQDEKKAQPEKSAKQDDKGVQQEKNVKPEEKGAKQENNAKPEEKNAKQENNAKPEEKNAKQENNAKPEEKDAQQQRAQPEQRAGGNRGGTIPADRYKANFGQGHTFRVTQGDYNNHRFQYGGYSFGFVGEWPTNWLYTQNVYVIDIDGVYYLCNPMYPGVNIALEVTL